ncbi:MAG: DUF2950 domain-containing protein [Victivallales bacterium]
MGKMKYFMIAMVLSLFISGCATVKPEPGQTVFATPEEASASLVEAVKRNDTARLMGIFGSQGKSLVFSGDEKCDSDSRLWFIGKAEEKTALVKGDAVGLEIGNDKWPFPVPIVKYDGKWFFHTAAGLEEMLSRRIGRNELNTIKVCRAIVTAQEEFARLKAAEGAREYAIRFISEKGKFNGLYWDAPDTKGKSPLGARIALASHENPLGQGRPYHGYYYMILISQGADAPGGAKSYVSNGKMCNGFAIAAYPAEYGVSGIKTFTVSRNGVVFEKDLGEDTAKILPSMTQFNPDDTWTPVRD